MRRWISAETIAIAYFLSGLIWIMGSDWLLSASLEDEALRTQIGTLKGYAFVAVTAGLLYIFVRTSETPPVESVREKSERPPPREFMRWLMTIVFLSLIPLTAGLAISQLHASYQEAQTYANIEAIARLKTGQIESWLAERERDWETLNSAPEFSRRVENLLATNDGDDARDWLQSRLDTFRKTLDYEGIALFRADGTTALTAGEAVDQPPRFREFVRAAQFDSREMNCDLIRHDSGAVYLHWAFPVLQNRGDASAPIGAVVFSENPDDFLFPLVETWPTASESGETLLVREEAGSIVFLNRLRKLAGPALSYTEPLSEAELPAAVALGEGGTGRTIGFDYNGERVYAAYRPVLGTDWMLVSKLDRGEVMAEVQVLQSWLMVLVAAAIVSLTGAALMLWNQQVRAHKLQLASEEAKKNSLYRVFYDLPFVGMGMAEPATGQLAHVNDRLCEIFGYDRESLLGLSWAELIHPEDLPDLLAVHQELIDRQRDGYLADMRALRANGETAVIKLNVKIIRDIDKTTEYTVVMIEDITEDARRETRLRQAAAVFESTREGVLVTDPSERILFVNQAFTTVTGYREEEVVGKKPSMMQSGRHSDEFYAAMWTSLGEEGSWQGEIWNRRKNGEVYPELLSISTVHDERGAITNYVGVFADLTKLKNTEDEIQFLVQHDALTTLPNRLLLLSCLEHSLKVAERRNNIVALLVFDLDRFTDLNNSYGHPAGDEVLRHVAECLKRRIRGTDTLARLGGDEFAVVLEDIAEIENAGQVAQSYIDAIRGPLILPNGPEVRINASAGISAFPVNGRSGTELLQQAEAALFQAKAQGRSSVRYSSEDLMAAALHRVTMESRLRRAIRVGELRVYYQPQVEIPSGKIVGAEALVRWQDPERGLVGPNEFIPVAESTGLIAELGAFVMMEALRQGKEWIDSGFPALRLAVNVSPVQFQRQDVAAWVFDALKRTEFPSEYLELELTESTLMTYEDTVLKTLDQVRSRGVRIAIDDFGTGYSSLASLRRFPVSLLKIDRSFIAEIPGNEEDCEIAAAIISMGHKLGVRVVAEGVETAEQLEFLAREGCDFYQGYLMSRPLPASEFFELARPSLVL